MTRKFVPQMEWNVALWSFVSDVDCLFDSSSMFSSSSLIWMMLHDHDATQSMVIVRTETIEFASIPTCHN